MRKFYPPKTPFLSNIVFKVVPKDKAQNDIPNPCLRWWRTINVKVMRRYYNSSLTVVHHTWIQQIWSSSKVISLKPESRFWLNINQNNSNSCWEVINLFCDGRRKRNLKDSRNYDGLFPFGGRGWGVALIVQPVLYRNCNSMRGQYI